MRIDLNYALVQASYWVTYCSVGSFAAIYLSWRGLSNTTIGFTASLYALLAIGIQLVISDFCDKNPQLPIKYVITALYVLSGAACLTMTLIGDSPFLLIGIFAVAVSLAMSISGYLNAQMVQLNNAGIPAHYGWPRGIGSLAYAIAAAMFGTAAEKYTPGILPKIFLTGAVICILSVLLMPKCPARLDSGAKKEFAQKVNISYKDMLKGNRTLCIFLAAVMLYGIGQTAGFTFTIRVMERIGKGTAEYGVSELIRAGLEMPMLFLSPLVLKKLSAKKVLYIAMLCGAVRIFTIACAPNLFWVYAGSAMNICGSGFYIFGSVLYVNSITGPYEKVRAQSLVTLCYSAGSILGNLYAGAVLDLAGLFLMLMGATVFNLLAGLLMMKNGEAAA